MNIYVYPHRYQSPKFQGTYCYATRYKSTMQIDKIRLTGPLLLQRPGNHLTVSSSSRPRLLFEMNSETRKKGRDRAFAVLPPNKEEKKNSNKNALCQGSLSSVQISRIRTYTTRLVISVHPSFIHFPSQICSSTPLTIKTADLFCNPRSPTQKKPLSTS
jgi:hypothetical protein